MGLEHKPRQDKQTFLMALGNSRNMMRWPEILPRANSEITGWAVQFTRRAIHMTCYPTQVGQSGNTFHQDLWDATGSETACRILAVGPTWAPHSGKNLAPPVPLTGTQALGQPQ